MTDVEKIVDFYAKPLASLPAGAYYFASPYTSDDRHQTEDWVREMEALVPEIINAYPKITPIVPVTITDPLANGHCEPAGGWYRFGLDLERLTIGIIIVKLEGWQQSRGIMLELGFAIGKGMHIATLDPQNICVDAPHKLPEPPPQTFHLTIEEHMEILRETGTYDDFTDEQLRERVIEIRSEDIPF